MSQSDYIKLKKTVNVLKSQIDLPPVLSPDMYTDFAEYNLETTVRNTKNAYSRLVPSTKQNIFTMEEKVSTCPTFTLCTNTNQRPNRVLNTAQKIVFVNGSTLPFKPAPTKRFNKVFESIRPNASKTCSLVTMDKNGVQRCIHKRDPNCPCNRLSL